MPHALSSPLASSLTATAVTPGTNWVDGAANMNAWYSNFDPCGGACPSIGYDWAWVGYVADTDSGGYPTGAYPQVGDVYYMHAIVAVAGNPPSGGDVPDIQAQLPQNTQLAVSASTPMYCFLFENGVDVNHDGKTNTWWNVSGESTCTTGMGTRLPTWLGYYTIASYISYEVQFPVRTTSPSNGLCSLTPPTGTSIPGTVSPACLLNHNDWAIGGFSPGAQQFDWVGVWVPQVTIDTTIASGPASSTTSTSAAFSFSSNTSGAGFECSLNSGAWAACVSPKSYSGLSVGGHNFQVRAAAVVSYDGIAQTRTDQTPASFNWTITSTSGGTSTTGGDTGGSSGGTHPAATTGGSGKISAAQLTVKSFKRSQAAKVKISYKISPKSKHLTFLLSMKKGAKWVTVRSFKKVGSFKGTYTITIKKLFGSKPIKAGRYRLKLSADKNSKVLSFRIT